MSIYHEATLFKGYYLSNETITKCLSEETIEQLIDANILHPLDFYWEDRYYIFGRNMGICADEGEAAVLKNPCPDPCQENRENEELMRQALELFPGNLPHTYPKYYIASVTR